MKSTGAFQRGIKIAAFLAFMGTGTLSRAALYVDPDGADTNTGEDWASALATVSNAVAKSAAGGVIYLKSGTYAALVPIIITGNTGLTLAGGYEGSGAPGNIGELPTILTRDASATIRIIQAVNSTLTFSGLTIQDGRSQQGAGLVLTNCTTLITHCIISGNRATAAGSVGIGVRAINGSLTIADSLIANNTHASWNNQGGGLYASAVNPLVIRDSQIVSNTVAGYASGTHMGHGAGLFLTGCQASIEGTEFTANTISGTGPQYGGAIHAVGTGNLAISNCTFEANGISDSANRRGGVLYVSGAQTGLITDSSFIKNSQALSSKEDIYLESTQPIVIRHTVVGQGWARGIYKLSTGSLLLTNTLFHSMGGHAVHVAAGAVTVANSTLANNIGYGVVNAAGAVTLVDSILWGNAAGGTALTGAGTIAATYCDLQDLLVGTENKSADPLFTAGYYLAADSPATNAGSATAAALGLGAHTTQTNGFPDAGQVDLGFHFTAGLSALAQSNLVLYVNNGTGNNGNDGWTSGTALANLSEAFGRAVDGSTIHIAQGSYSAVTGESMPMQPSSLNLRLLGSDPATTFLNGGGNSQIFSAVSVGTLYLEGLTFTNGYLSSGSGAGLYLENTQTTMTNCVVRGNRGMNPISGIAISAYGGSLLVVDSEVSNNWCTQYDSQGGGIYANEVLLTVRSSVVASNTVNGYANGSKPAYGGGISLIGGQAVIDGSTFIDNAAAGSGLLRYGGALYASGTGTLLVTNSVFSANQAGSSGGAFYITGARSSLIADCVVRDNNKAVASAEDFYINSSMPTIFRHTELSQGGYRGIYKLGVGALTLTNTLVHTYAGHGVHVTAGAVSLANSTLAGNTGWGLYNEAGAITLIDTIVWGNASGGQTTTGAGSIAATYSDLQDTLVGDGNQSADPLFELGYYLMTGSPCIGTGSQQASVLGLDTRTTQTAGTADAGQVDIGYHYREGVGGDSIANLTLYVNIATGNNANDGWTEGDALKTIDEALDRVTPGGTIHIAAGDYTPANGEVYPLQPTKFNLTLVGAGRETTLLDAGGATRILQADNVGNLNLQLEGLTFANGLATNGAGLYLVNCGTVITNCNIRGNRISGNGSGIGIYANGASLQVFDTDFIDNTDAQANDTYGGALAGVNLALTMRACNIVSNSAAAGTGGGGANSAGGGGVYLNGGTALLDNSLFLGNHAGGAGSYGGAIHVAGTAAVVLTNCVFEGNHIRVDTTPMGVVYLENSASMQMLDCRFEGNTNASGKNADDIYHVSTGAVSLWNTILALGSGSGIRKTGSGSLSMTNTLIHGYPGNGVWVSAGNATMDNVTIAGNGGWGVTNSAGTVSLLNSIVWANTVGGGSGVNATYSDIQGGVIGDGNIDADPLFTDAGVYDYSLNSGSPCRNKGSNDVWMDTGVDLAGNKRIVSQVVDMGAYEIAAPAGTLILFR